MEAERVVVELLAKVDGFDGKVAQSAAGFEGSMGRIEKAATKAETTVARSSDARIAAIRKESAQISAAAKLLGTQINDIGHLMNGPNSPFVVPVKQAPVVSRAMLFISSGAAALGGVIGGVLVSAVIAYVASLAEMILKSRDAGKEIDDLVEKLQEQERKARLTEAAQIAFGMTLEGVTKALDDNEKALESLNDEHKSAAFEALKQTNLQALILQGIRDRTEATLQEAKAQIELNRAQVKFADKPGLRTALTNEADAATKRVEELEGKLKGIDSAAARAADQHSKALAALAVEIGSRDKVEQIRVTYDRLINATAERLRLEGKTGAEIVKQTKALRDQQRLEEERARKKPRAAAPDREIGGSLTSAQARSIVNAQFGAGTVTSGFRTQEHNKRVGGVEGSLHLADRAIDVAKKPGVTLNKITELLRRQGVTIAEALDEGNHYHVAWKNARSEAERLAEAAKRAADAEMRRVQAFQNEQANMEGQVIDARQALVTSAEEIARLELAAIEISRKKYADNVASLQEQGKLREGEAKELLKLNEERAKLRAELVQRREDQRKFRVQEAEAQRQLEAQTGAINVEEELLQSRQGIARTTKQRHDLEQRLIDLQFKEERLHLQAQIAQAERLKIELQRLETLRALSDEEKAELQRAQDQAELAQERLNTQDERRSNAETANDRANAGPLDSFFGDIPNTADEINEALESIAAGGLATFTDALTDAIVNWRGFGDVALQTLRSVAAGIIRLGIQQLLLHTIGKALGTTAVAATAAQAGATAAAWAPAAAAASLATLGANAGPAAAALASTHALSAALSIPKGFRKGGYTGEGALDAAAGIVHRREFVFDAEATRRIGVGNLEAMRRGVQPANGAAVAPRGSNGGSMSQSDLAQLGGIVREAITAMPPVNLFPTFDPTAAMRAALNTREGRQVMLEFMGENRGAVGGALQ